jgi:hypothetical protein
MPANKPRIEAGVWSVSHRSPSSERIVIR